MFKKIKRKIELIIFRIKYGFSESDLWDLDTTIAKFILPRIKALKKIKQGCLLGNGEVKTEQDWNEIMDKMILSFELIIIQFDVTDIEEERKNQKYIEKGLRLFAKYFQALWDLKYE